MTRGTILLVVGFFSSVTVYEAVAETPVDTAVVAPVNAGSDQKIEKKQGSIFLLGEELLKLRDPFRMPKLDKASTIPKTELEQFPLDAFRLMGVLTGPKNIRAMLLAPNGKTYFVSEKMKIGLKSGVIRSITSDYVLVRETIVNPLGQQENIDTEIVLPVEGKADPTKKSDTDPKRE